MVILCSNRPSNSLLCEYPADETRKIITAPASGMETIVIRGRPDCNGRGEVGPTFHEYLMSLIPSQHLDLRQAADSTA